MENPFQCFRANWRSNVRFPWQLPKISASDGLVGQDETLFIDITFDFIIFPTEIVKEGRTHCCHVLKKEDFWSEDMHKEHQLGGNNMIEEANSVAMSVAIRIGALVATPQSQCSDNGSSIGKDEDLKGDGYQYYYNRGDDALTVSDLDEHCRGIDIVLEEMDSADVARIMGDAFLEGCGGTPWQVMAKSESGCATANNNLNTIDNIGMAEQTKKSWHLKVHHEALQADGILPLSNNGDNSMGEWIGRCMLDMILLQSNASSRDGVCISVPRTEALMLWKTIDSSIVRAVEQLVEPSPQKMSPAREICVADAESVSAARNSYAQKAAQKEELKSSKPKPTASRPPKPQATALFARGKKTTLGGGRRKKPKFTLGPA